MNKPPPGKALLGDWKGMMVITAIELKNGRAMMPKGSRAVVVAYASGLTLTFWPCEHCGVATTLRRVTTSSVVPA